MIDFKSKSCDALAFKISAAGHWVVFEDGIPLSSDDKAVQPIIDAFTLVEYKAGKQAQIESHAKVLRDKSLNGVSPAEVAAWSVKLAEAKTFGKAGADTATLAKEAQVRNIPLAELVAKVQANANDFGDREAQIAGVAGKHKDALMALTDFRAVEAYDFTGGWPEV